MSWPSRAAVYPRPTSALLILLLLPASSALLSHSKQMWSLSLSLCLSLSLSLSVSLSLSLNTGLCCDQKRLTVLLVSFYHFCLFVIVFQHVHTCKVHSLELEYLILVNINVFVCLFFILHQTTDQIRSTYGWFQEYLEN